MNELTFGAFVFSQGLMLFVAYAFYVVLNGLFRLFK